MYKYYNCMNKNYNQQDRIIMDIHIQSRPVTLECIYTALLICATSNKQSSDSLLYNTYK